MKGPPYAATTFLSSERVKRFSWYDDWISAAVFDCLAHVLIVLTIILSVVLLSV